ncbi:MAG: 7-carboxy-7-deazaguanine synthase QueE [Oligoflexia bacterium]|nr:7-carboxy-7-deazaguanine synthase QueE [Oligoflexia bacterium]
MQKIININSIFLSHEGEGIHLGKAQIFIRVQGCSLKCKNCDTPEALSFKNNKIFTIEEILEEINKINKKYKLINKRISITGGDPLDPSHKDAILDLIKVLKKKKYFINIEAAGNVINPQIFNLVDSISFDYKTPSAVSVNRRETLKSLSALPAVPALDLLKKLFLNKKYRDKLQIKSVIESKKDFLYVYSSYLQLSNSLLSSHPSHSSKNINLVNWILTPSYSLKMSESDFKKKFDKIFRWNLTLAGGAFRVIGQQHKWVYGTRKKNV